MMLGLLWAIAAWSVVSVGNELLGDDDDDC